MDFWNKLALIGMPLIGGAIMLAVSWEQALLTFFYACALLFILITISPTLSFVISAIVLAYALFNLKLSIAFLILPSVICIFAFALSVVVALMIKRDRSILGNTFKFSDAYQIATSELSELLSGNKR
jgi:hypothetical protein